jgi:hypothetical protein
MNSTVDSYITSPKSQTRADDRKSLLAGVVTAAPAYFIKGANKAPAV